MQDIFGSLVLDSSSVEYLRMSRNTRRHDIGQERQKKELQIGLLSNKRPERSPCISRVA